MSLLKDAWDHIRRAAVNAVESIGVHHYSPCSPELPKESRSSMPDLFDRFPLVLPWSKPQPIDPTLHTVWILDNTAFRSPQPDDDDKRPGLGELLNTKLIRPFRIISNVNNNKHDSSPKGAARSGWEVEYVVCYFIKNSGRDLSRVISTIAHELQISEDDIAARKRISERVQPFVDTVLPKRTVRIQIGGVEEQTLGPSSYSGVSSDLLQLHFNPTDGRPWKSAPVTIPVPFGMHGITIPASEHGWGIISDIDDTIKTTMTPSPLGILHSTFIVEHPNPIPGMPELYSHLSHLLHSPQFFYLSASPYNLYPFLRNFRDRHFPPGTIILRDASWQNLTGLIASLTQGTEGYKVDRMRKIHSWFPRRKMILIGDSTQRDPESYGAVARMFPRWVRGIFIRKVEGIAEMDEEGKNSGERFERAFEGVERGVWRVFREPGEIRERVRELVRREEEGDSSGGVGGL